MGTTLIGSKRAELGFEKCVVENFSFLTELGFEAVVLQTTLVRYESDHGYANVYHGRRSYELGFEVGRRRRLFVLPPQQFTLRDIIEAATGEAPDDRPMLQASTAARVEEWLPHLAALVQQYARPALLGDKDFYRLMRAAERRWSQDIAKAINDPNIRENAESAWKQRQYSRAARLFSTIGGDLTRSELLKLDYCRKRCPSPSSQIFPQSWIGLEADSRYHHHEAPNAKSGIRESAHRRAASHRDDLQHSVRHCSQSGRFVVITRQSNCGHD